MTEQEKIALIEEAMELDEGELKADSVLKEYEEWDSLSKLALIAMAKKEFDKILSTDDIKAFQTVGDICKWMN